MTAEPSFSYLYRRSRYFRDDNETSGSRQNRREVFAVAAVAFTLKHDPRFCRHFFRVVCGFPDWPDQPPPKIELQPHDHSDLAIKDSLNASLVIVEFKMGANLEEKQNPKYQKVFFGAGGYGNLILDEHDYRDFSRKTYIVLNDLKDFEDGERRGLQFRARNLG